jgi:hypothetical protein
MAYTVINFKTKKALKEAVAEYMDNINKGGTFGGREEGGFGSCKAVRCFQPGLGPDLSNFTGRVALEGPHYPKPHTWYAEAELKDGIVIKVS